MNPTDCIVIFRTKGGMSMVPCHDQAEAERKAEDIMATNPDIGEVAVSQIVGICRRKVDVSWNRTIPQQIEG